MSKTGIKLCNGLLLVVLLCGFGNLTAQPIEAQLPRIASGVVMPDRGVDLAAKMMGRITRITHLEGDSVKQGDLLVALDSATLQAELASALASVELAQAELKNLKKRETRLKDLQKKHSVSEDALDSAIFSAAAATAKLKIAKATVASVKSSLKEMKILAPFNGVITNQTAEVGAVTQPGASLLRLEDHSRLKFRAKVKDRDIPSIKLGDVVQVTIDALSENPLPGKVSKIIPSGDLKTHAFVVEISLPPTTHLYPGMFGKVRF